MTIRADFQLLASNLMAWTEANEVTPPDPAVVKVFPRISSIQIPVDWETCCIEMSFAMNMGGLRLVSGDLQDANGFYYYQRVPDLRVYINQNYEVAENYARVDANNALTPLWLLQSFIADRTGIIGFGDRHIDLWDGSRRLGQGIIDSAVWNADSAKTLGISFWPVSL